MVNPKEDKQVAVISSQPRSPPAFKNQRRRQHPTESCSSYRDPPNAWHRTNDCGGNGLLLGQVFHLLLSYLLSYPVTIVQVGVALYHGRGAASPKLATSGSPGALFLVHVAIYKAHVERLHLVHQSTSNLGIRS